MTEIYLLGVGRNTPVFIDLAEQSGYTVSGLYHYNDDRTGDVEHGFTILGSFSDLFDKNNLSQLNLMLTMGDRKIRMDLAEHIRQKNGRLPAIIHPTAVLSRFARIEEGVCIGAFSHVQADSWIKRDTVILSGVNISHHNTIGPGCFIAGGATIGAYTTLGDSVFIGQGALTISGKVKHIGNNVYVSAGSLVTKSIPDDDIVAGRPATSIKRD